MLQEEAKYSVLKEFKDLGNQRTITVLLSWSRRTIGKGSNKSELKVEKKFLTEKNSINCPFGGGVDSVLINKEKTSLFWRLLMSNNIAKAMEIC